MTAGCNYQTLIDARRLHQCKLSQHGRDPQWRILDARFSLADSTAGRRAYEQGHIAGAVYIDLEQQLSSPVSAGTGRHPLPDAGQLSEWLQAADVQPQHQVVVYDDMNGAMAARCWWLLRLLGYPRVAVLDGGLAQWQRCGYELTAVSLSDERPRSESKLEPGAEAAEVEYKAEFDQSQIATTAEVLVNLECPRFVLVDARTVERFNGEQEPIDPIAGHVPGALNRPLQLNLTTEGCFKAPELLAAEWHELMKERPSVSLVHMCGSGVTACHNLLAMEVAGLPGSRVYVGSWSEWISNPQHPVACSSA